MKLLPVLATFGHAIRSTRDNLGFAFHISWPWMLALLPMEVAGNLYIRANDVGPVDEFNAKVAVPTILMGLVGMIVFSSIAVSWHRYILLDEIPHGLQRFRLDGTVWGYVGKILRIALVLGLAVGAVTLVLLLATAALGQALGKLLDVLAVVVLAGLAAGAIIASYRLSIVLPAVALGRHDVGFRHAWSITQGNSWRFLGLAILYFAVGIAAALLAAAVGYGLGQATGSVGASVSIAVQILVNWVVSILGVTMLTSLYGFFVEDRKF